MRSGPIDSAARRAFSKVSIVLNNEGRNLPRHVLPVHRHQISVTSEATRKELLWFKGQSKPYLHLVKLFRETIAGYHQDPPTIFPARRLYLSGEKNPALPGGTLEGKFV